VLFGNVQHKALLQYLAVGRLQNIPAHFVGFHTSIPGNNTAMGRDICAEFCSRHLWCFLTTRFPNITWCIYILQSQQMNIHSIIRKLVLQIPVSSRLYHSKVSAGSTRFGYIPQSTANAAVDTSTKIQACHKVFLRCRHRCGMGLSYQIWI